MNSQHQVSQFQESESLGHEHPLQNASGVKTSFPPPPAQFSQSTDPVSAAASAGAAAGMGSGPPGKVTAESGIRLHGTPSPADPVYKEQKGIAATIYPKGTEIVILQQESPANPGWSQVKTSDGQVGWIESRYIQKSDPVKDALTRKTYTIQPGDTLEALVKREYPEFNYETGNDRRTIVQALSVLNEGSNAIYFGEAKGSWFKDRVADSEMADTRKIYQSIRLKAGKEIRLPTVSCIQGMQASGQVGSRAEWKNNAVAIGQGYIGFREGIAIGFGEAAVDAVTGLWDMVKDIFSGAIFEQAYDLIKKMADEGLGFIWDGIKDFFVGTWEECKAAWNNPNVHDRWMFFGKIIGMILFEVVLAVVTAGAGVALTKIPRVANLLNKFPFLKKITGTKPGKDLDLDLDAQNKQDLVDADEIRSKKAGERFTPNKTYNYGGHKYMTNEHGRVSKVQGKLDFFEKGDRPKTNKRNTTEVGHQGNKPDPENSHSLENDHGGHLIGNRFGGTNETINLVPQNADLNWREWKKMENHWADLLTRDPKIEVEIEIEILYDGDGVRPTEFFVKEKFNGIPQDTKHFLNQIRG